MRARHKKWALPFLQEHPDLVKTDLPLDSPFYAVTPLNLEIGSGKGDFVIQMAARGGHWLALERDVSISGTLAKKIIASELSNILVMSVDFDEVFPKLKPGVFAGVYLNFSDPWPKKKHWKRRLTTRERLAKMSKLLTDEGRLYIKTDNDGLYAFTEEEAAKAGLVLLESQFAYELDPAKDAMTEYESAFRQEGKPIHRLVFGKKVK